MLWTELIVFIDCKQLLAGLSQRQVYVTSKQRGKLTITSSFQVFLAEATNVKTVCDPYPSSTVTLVAALVTYSHTLMTWLQKKNKKKKKRKSKEMLDSKMKSTFPTFRRKSQTTISDNIIDWGISLGNSGAFTRIWANFWTDDVFTWATSQHGTVQILLQIAVLFRIIRRFWETAHLPLPYGNIFSQV